MGDDEKQQPEPENDEESAAELEGGEAAEKATFQDSKDKPYACGCGQIHKPSERCGSW